MIVKKLLRHQQLILQSPYIHPNIRFHFLIAGYASGKSSALGDCLLFAVQYFSGKRDLEGHNPKIGLCAKSLTFLKKTVSGAIVNILQNTQSSYKYDKAHNIIYIGGVEIMLIPTENPQDIYGYDLCFDMNTPVMTKDGEKAIKDIKVGEYVYTRKGLKKVTHVWDKGNKECIPVTVNGKTTWCTPDHRYLDTFNNEIEAQDLTKDTPLVYITKEKPLDLQLAHLDAKTSNEEEQSRICNVYDIEVEDEHNFFANGVLVHNCCAFIDELDELPTYTAEEVVKSINDRCRQSIEGARAPWMIFTTTSQGLKGTYQTVMQFRKQGIGHIIIRARTKDNIYLKKEYVESMYRIYNDKEIKCLLEGEFVSIDSGLVFPDYNPAINDLDDSGSEIWRNIKPYETVYIGQDFNSGFNHAQAFVVRKGIIFMIKDYDFPDDRSAPKVFRRDFPTCHIRWIPDMTSKSQFMMYAQELNSRDIHLALRNKNPEVSDRNFGVNKCLYAKRLYICSTCKRSRISLLTHQKDPKTGKPLKGGIGSPDHDSDCLGMAVYYMLSWREDLADIYNITIGRIISKNREYTDEEEEIYQNVDKIPELQVKDVIVQN